MLLVEKLAENPDLQGEAFNFSNELQLSVIELVDRILNLMESDLRPAVQNKASNEILHQYLSAEKAREILGWSPKYSLDQGLLETIEWYREFFNCELQ